MLMSEGNEQKQRQEPDEAAQSLPSGSSALWLVCVLSLLLALAAAAGSGWLWWERQVLEQRLTQLEDDALPQTQFEAHHRATQRRVDALESQWQQNRATLEALRPMAREGREAWLQAEALWLLRMAERNLALGGEPALSMAAMRAADEQLRELADPDLLVVREALAEDMARLEAMAWPDIDGMVLRLASLARQTSEWPLRRPEHPEARIGLPEQAPEPALTEEGPAWQRLLGNLTEVARGLVVVRRHDEPLAPLLPPEQAYFKRLNAALQLDALRLTLLRQDADLFMGQLEQSRDWIERHFDSDSEGVSAALQTLHQWQSVEIDPPRPEIGKALQRLQRIHADETGDDDDPAETES